MNAMQLTLYVEWKKSQGEKMKQIAEGLNTDRSHLYRLMEKDAYVIHDRIYILSKRKNKPT